MFGCGKKTSYINGPRLTVDVRERRELGKLSYVPRKGLNQKGDKYKVGDQKKATQLRFMYCSPCGGKRTFPAGRRVLKKAGWADKKKKFVLCHAKDDISSSAPLEEIPPQKTWGHPQIRKSRLFHRKVGNRKKNLKIRSQTSNKKIKTHKT